MKNTIKELKSLCEDSIIKQIIMQYFNIDLLNYSLMQDKTLSDIDKANLLSIAKQYANNTPLQYIFKKTFIKDLEFECMQGVLIAREDSEVLIDIACEYILQNDIKSVFEIGFGSGIISIILSLFTNANIKACDINKKALKLANINALKHNAKCEFVLGDFAKFDFCKFDFIVSNPPYISTTYKLDEYVKKEPKTALYAGKKGYELLFKIIEKCNVSKTKALACEFGYDQKDILEKKLNECGYETKFYKDLAGYDRAFLAIRKDNYE